jgi:hypothetical protein
MTGAEMRAGLDLMPTWALEQKAAANRSSRLCADDWLPASRSIGAIGEPPTPGGT